MNHKLKGEYKKEYNSLVSIIKHEAASGAERDTVLEELYLLFETAEKNGDNIQTLYGDSRENFIEEIIDMLPKNKYKGMQKTFQRLALAVLYIAVILLLYAIGMNIYYELSTPNTVIIGGAFATTSIQLLSPGYGVGLCLLALILTIALIVIIQKKSPRKGH